MKRTLPLLAFAALAAACRPSAPAMEVVVPTAAPSTSPTPGAVASSRALPSASPTATPSGPVVGLVAQALTPDGPLAGADVKVYRLGQPAPMAGGKSGTNGAFLISLGSGFPVDAPVQIVATKGGKTVVAMGTAGIVASGAGNIVAQGGGNIVASGAGNIISGNGSAIISTNSAGIVASGAGNIVASGAGNFGLLDAAAEPPVRPIDPASSLTWALLGPRFRGAGQALTLPGSGDVIRKDLANLNLAYDELVQASSVGLRGGANAADVQKLLSGFDADGKTKLDPTLSQAFGTLPGLKDAFQRAAIHTEDAIVSGVADGGLTPAPDTLQPITFAGTTADTITVSTDGQYPEGSNGATKPSDNY